MRAFAALLFCAGFVFSQSPGARPFRYWRNTFHGYLNRPPGSWSARDLLQLETELALAGQNCAGLSPSDYEANRALVRQMAAYFATIQVASGDRQMNLSLRRLARSLAVFPCAYGVAAPGGQPPPGAIPAPTPPAPGTPPFALTAPALADVPQPDQDTAKDLRDRYNGDASRAATAWKNAQTVRQNLAAKGMSLNAGAAAAVDRLKLLLDDARDALRDHKWDDALSSLQGVEATIQKVNETVGN
jgi:hypothetical protein